MYGATLKNLKVITGEHNLNIPGEGEQTFSVVKVTVHPQFDNTTMDNDYAIWQISPSANIATSNATIGIVCLPPDVVEIFVGARLGVSGWGRTVLANNLTSPVLQAALLTCIPNANCNASRIPITSNEMCTYVPYTSTCHGDSGGKV